MALSDTSPASHNASLAPFDPAAPRAIPFDALARLPRLHDEAGRDWRTARFLARAPLACLLLMATAAIAIATRGGALQPDFAWSVLLLIGITAMIRSHVRGHARSLRRAPLEEAAGDLRFLLLYIGAAWGAGAYLILPGQPAPFLAVAFALVPALGLSLILRDEKAAAAFTTPAVLLTAGAAVMGAWPADLWVALIVLAGGIFALFLPALQQRRVPTVLPPMLLPQ